MHLFSLCGIHLTPIHDSSRYKAIPVISHLYIFYKWINKTYDGSTKEFNAKCQLKFSSLPGTLSLSTFTSYGHLFPFK